MVMSPFYNGKSFEQLKEERKLKKHKLKVQASYAKAKKNRKKKNK